MWAILLGTLVIGTIAGILYLGNRFTKFTLIQKTAKGKKLVRYLLGLLFPLLILLGTGTLLGPINAEIVILHLVAVWLACDGTAWLIQKKRGKTPKKYLAGAFALGITAIYLTCAWFLANHVWRTPYTLETDKQVENLRIVQIADSHVGNTFDGEGFLKHVQAMQAENPDLVVITGDFVDDDTSREDMIAACRALGTLETTYGVFYVFGNHDKGYYGPEFRGYSGQDLVDELEKNRVTVLQDQIVPLGDSFYLIGRQDRFEEHRPGSSRASMEDLTAGLDPNRYSIVLDHQPYDYDAQEAAGVDLVLSGHTHGGQFFPFNYMGQWTGIDAKTYGLEKRSNTSFIVTSGIADWALKFRTGCRSEYVVVDVQGRP